MRTAIVSDIHGNLTSLEAVLADLRAMAPDLILHGGDLADNGASPADIIDTIRDLKWPGVAGNTDEMLFRPESLTGFATQSPQMQPLLPIVQEMAAFSRAELGAERLAWLRALPHTQAHGPFTLLHATPENLWRAPAAEEPDSALQASYAPLGSPVVVYAHLHRPFVRSLHALVVANTGSVGMPYDGDRRASYLLLDDAVPTVRRVEYDLSREMKALAASRLPHADWIARILTTASPQMP